MPPLLNIFSSFLLFVLLFLTQHLVKMHFSAVNLLRNSYIAQSKRQKSSDSSSRILPVLYLYGLTTHSSPHPHSTTPIAMLLPLNIKCIYLSKGLAILFTWNASSSVITIHGTEPYLFSICFWVRSSLDTQFKIESPSQFSPTHFLLYVSPKHY